MNWNEAIQHLAETHWKPQTIMKTETLKLLKQLANQTAKSEDKDFSVYDWSGGNIDDAYSLGADEEEIYFARRILEMEGEDW